ncbi:hypothetical protein DESAMIL20_1813 [Desulfurella amilsii]|uniref:Methyl-accepting chemotaxis protein n=1 Tax=Desulfurella amilsii TaxID=1562698 RepID=A0A1X4XXJ2_9BACT|nr:hypothetical protein [Desulfurella amilsii]OSS42260.1 hypothetical protein DESAMIL20_1813 [Desulfurella amilsii]
MGSKKTCYIVILILLIAVVGVYFYGTLKLNSYKKAQELAFSNKIAQLNVNFDAKQMATKTSLIESLAVPLSYFVKNAIETNNNQSINECFNELVRHKGFKDINLIKAGKVFVGTNKKYEGEAFNKIYPKEFTDYKEITIKQIQPGLSYLIVPIMSTNAQLGFVVVTFGD